MEGRGGYNMKWNKEAILQRGERKLDSNYKEED